MESALPSFPFPIYIIPFSCLSVLLYFFFLSSFFSFLSFFLFSKFFSFLFIFLLLFLLSQFSLTYLLRVGKPPTQESPGYATAKGHQIQIQNKERIKKQKKKPVTVPGWGPGGMPPFSERITIVIYDKICLLTEEVGKDNSCKYSSSK